MKAVHVKTVLIKCMCLEVYSTLFRCVMLEFGPMHTGQKKGVGDMCIWVEYDRLL
jgi:hypothetical protein